LAYVSRFLPESEIKSIGNKKVLMLVLYVVWMFPLAFTIKWNEAAQFGVYEAWYSIGLVSLLVFFIYKSGLLKKANT
tara:strand:+ start:309 stop:539 length:231 start_codon:yes stop_codon:yes gene_type:complete